VKEKVKLVDLDLLKEKLQLKGTSCRIVDLIILDLGRTFVYLFICG
jgi:hypothetical protein